jgi:WD40 repeat protein
MPAGTDGVRQIAFGGTNDVVAFLGSAGLSADQLLTVAHVKTGALIGRVTLPNGESVSGIAVGPTGRFAAVHVSAPGSGDVVVLHELASNTAAKRFTPYSRKGAITNPDLAFVGFVGPDRLLTAHQTSGFDVWQLPDMTKVCGVPGRPKDAAPKLERNGFSMRCKNAALSPDGKTFAMYDAGGFSFFDTTTAQRTAQTPAFIPGRSANFWAAAFSPDGKRFAATTSYFTPQQVSSIQVWDVASGKRLSAAAVEPLKTGTAMAFWGPDHVILAQGGYGSVDVMAVATGEVVAKVDARTSGSSQMIAPDAPGGALWYAFDNKIIRNESTTLGSVPWPGALPGRTLVLGRDGPEWK